MRYRNAKFICYAILNGQIVAHRVFATEQAKNNWCNKQYVRFGEDVMVDVHDWNTFDKVETWAS